MESDEKWQTCVVDKSYEINVNFPHQIRKKAKGRILKEHDQNGYLAVALNQKHKTQHSLIANQFIPNPEGLPQVDHINQVRTDNRIENLRWVSCSENSQNRSSHKGCYFEYFDELPAPCKPFVFYKGHDFEGYMIDEAHNIYCHNGLKYRKLIRLMMNGIYEYYYLYESVFRYFASTSNSDFKRDP
jgi:hypothetical protein